jgi:hypothetical protein
MVHTVCYNSKLLLVNYSWLYFLFFYFSSKYFTILITDSVVHTYYDTYRMYLLVIKLLMRLLKVARQNFMF